MPWNEEVLSCVQTNDQPWVTYDSYIALWLYVNTLLFPRGTLTPLSHPLSSMNPRYSLVKNSLENAGYWGMIFGRFKNILAGYEFSLESKPDSGE